MSRRALLLLSLASTAGSALVSAGSMPASLVVLPLSSFANTTLVSGYACTPTYSSQACSGHGDCYLLLDEQATASQPFINQSSELPIATGLTALDMAGIDDDTPLPAAVCICDSGYTGRGDYIQHDALDGDSCQVNEGAIVGLCTVGMVLHFFVLLLALHRLTRWLSWYRQHSSSGAAAMLSSPELSSNDADESSTSGLRKFSNGTPMVAARLVSQEGASQALSGSPPMAIRSASSQPHHLVSASPMPAAKTITGGRAAVGSPVVQGRLPPLKRRPSTGGMTSRWVAFKHISFCHPLLSTGVAATTIAIYALRLDTGLTLGHSVVIGAVGYGAQECFFVASCIATYNNLRLAATITRTQTGVTGLSTIVRRVKVCMYSLVGFSCLFWLLILIMPYYQQAQQSTTVLMLTLLQLPTWLLGALSMASTRRIISTLVQHLDKLSSEQRDARLALHRKLRSQMRAVVVVVVLLASCSLILTVSEELRQAGVTYFYLFCPLLNFVILVFRLSLLKPPGGAAGGSATVAPTMPPPTQMPLPAHMENPPLHAQFTLPSAVSSPSLTET